MMNFIKNFTNKPFLIKYILVSLIIIICGTAYCISRYGISGSNTGEYGSLETGSEEKEAHNNKSISGGGQTEGSVVLGAGSQAGNGGADIEKTEAECYVYVCGYVNKPDVYQCREGARIYEVIELAGGFRDDADKEYLNLVAAVTDGQKIYVPSKDEGLSASGGSSDSGYGVEVKVNINTADENQLMTLPGIGESRAADIIGYRNANGRFERIEDIMKVNGIKNASYEKIKDLIKV